MPEAISQGDLIPMDVFQGEALEIDLVYADAKHPENIFDISVYHKHARLILHRELARIVLKTSRVLKERYGWTLVLKDGLRTIEAQHALMNTHIVRRNPHWLEEPRLLSSPGQGAHPRGMAIDVSLKDANGVPVDMGTLFDAMVQESARAYDGFSPEILQNRMALEQAFVEAAKSLSLPLLALPSEWWDFRLPASYNGAYEPLSDDDLPDGLKMCKQDGNIEAPDFTRLAKDILLSI